jgi:hypothetical protein
MRLRTAFRAVTLANRQKRGAGFARGVHGWPGETSVGEAICDHAIGFVETLADLAYRQNNCVVQNADALNRLHQHGAFLFAFLDKNGSTGWWHRNRLRSRDKTFASALQQRLQVA